MDSGWWIAEQEKQIPPSFPEACEQLCLQLKMGKTCFGAEHAKQTPIEPGNDNEAKFAGLDFM